MSRSAIPRGTLKRGALTASYLSRASSTTPSQSNVQSTPTTIYGGGIKDPTGKTAEYSSMDDQCPVCKSDRYLNPKLRLLVSSCYHKMYGGPGIFRCESCIDRLFTLGPAPCPICSKTVRKINFSHQTFEDLTVEREVAIRKRVTKAFNKRREDFPDLTSYNDYLEMVEDMTFNLINGIDVPETEARIQAYRKENEALIQLNVQREKLELQAIQEEEQRERLDREDRMRELRIEEEEERLDREKERQDIITGLESAKEGTAARIIAKTRAEAHKRTAAKAALASVSSQRFQRSREIPTVSVPDEPHQPLTDNWYAYDDKYILRTIYDDPLSELVRADRDGLMRAGGYRVEEAWGRAIRLAVAGLEMSPLQGDCNG